MFVFCFFLIKSVSPDIHIGFGFICKWLTKKWAFETAETTVTSLENLRNQI